MLDLGLGWTASPGRERLLPERVRGCAAVWDVETEGLADVHLCTHERRDELEPALMLDAADGTHLVKDILNGSELVPQILVPLVDGTHV